MNHEAVRRGWARRSGEFSPTYYAHRGPDGTSEAVRDVLDRYVDPADPVLELGCSSGRHLAHLLDGGFTDLWGIELNGAAFEVMAEAYPDLATTGTFRRAAIEDVVGELADDQFGAVYSVETLQHVHPDADWVFPELARIADDLLVTVENESAGVSTPTPDAGQDGSDAGDPSSGDGGDAPGDGDDGPASTTDPDVSYVDDGTPLYHRDWHRVFTRLGLAEVAVVPGDRNTLRAFRP